MPHFVREFILLQRIQSQPSAAPRPRLFQREIDMLQRIGWRRVVLASEQVWVRRDLVQTFRTRQAISLVDKPFEFVTDLRQRVLGSPETLADIRLDILTPFAEGSLGLLVTGDLAVEGDFLQTIGLPVEVFADLGVATGIEVVTDGDLALTIQDVLADARLSLVIWGGLAESDLRLTVSGPAESDADLGQTILSWLTDFDGGLRVGEIIRQESHLFH